MTMKNHTKNKKQGKRGRVDARGILSRRVSCLVLTRVIDDHRNLDGLLDSEHGIKEYLGLDSRDRLLVRAIVTTALRHRGEITESLNNLMNRPPPSKARHLIHTLHIAAAQIMYMDVPDHAAVDLAVSALHSERRSHRFSGFGNAVLRNLCRAKTDNSDSPSIESCAEKNCPDWLWDSLVSDYGESRTRDIIVSCMSPPPLDITTKSHPEDWAERLGGRYLFGNSVRLPPHSDITNLAGFSEGEWWVQNAGATLAVLLLGDVSGKRVLDLCAAPGGKTAQLLNRGALVTCVESSSPRLSRLRENLDRLSLVADLVHADLFDYESDASSSSPKKYDFVLLDSPCSSTGTLRRHPDVAWTKSLADIESLSSLQERMIRHSANFLELGGLLVYSNCSLLSSEGESVVSRITSSCDNLELVSSSVWCNDLVDSFIIDNFVRTFPSDAPDTPDTVDGLDGFFCACFRRI